MRSRIGDWSKQIHRNRLMRHLLGKEGKGDARLPRSMEGRYTNVPVYNDCLSPEPFAYLTVIVKPTPDWSGTKRSGYEYYGRNRKSSNHRVFVVCENCNKEIPFGRYHQHYGTKVCRGSK